MKRLTLIGASTGGPGLIEKIVESLPLEFRSPIIVAQHMDNVALSSFAKRLGRLKGHSVRLVESHMKMDGGSIFILSDTSHLLRRNGSIIVEPSSDKGFFHPTIDTLFHSAASLENTEIMAVLLSGIGSDGAEGMKKLKNAGHLTIAQDEKTSIVYGMPKRAKEVGGAKKILSIDSIVKKIAERAFL